MFTFTLRANQGPSKLRMAKPKLTLYVDIVSPFAYMAYYTTRHSAMFKEVDITYKPIFLGGLMKACDNRTPIDIRNKGTWIGIERLRWSKLFSIPMTPDTPEGFPILTLQTQRAMCALELLSPTQMPEALDALYAAFWVHGNSSVGKADGFTPVLEKALGKELTAKVLEGMNGKEAKGRLSANTDQALNGGAFGLPWWECTNKEGGRETFWGFDHLGQVVDFLGVARATEGGMRAML